MTANNNKAMIYSWLLLSFAGVVASWSNLSSAEPQLWFCAPSLLAMAMLAWIRRHPVYYQQLFYRLSWQLSILLSILAVAPATWLYVGA